MNVYYDKKGKILGRAWSISLGNCKNTENHLPHSYHGEYTVYGPYMCAGLPYVELYDSPPRTPVNG